MRPLPAPRLHLLSFVANALFVVAWILLLKGGETGRWVGLALAWAFVALRLGAAWYWGRSEESPALQRSLRLSAGIALVGAALYLYAWWRGPR